MAYVAGVLTLLASSLLTMSLTTRLTALISHPAASSLLPNPHLLLPEYCPTNPFEIDVMYDPTLNMESLYGIEDSLVWKSLISYGNFPKQLSPKCLRRVENVCRLISAGDQSSCIGAATSPQVSLSQENESEIWTLHKLLEMTQASAVMNNVQLDKSGESQHRTLPDDNIASEQPQETTLTADDGHLSRLVPHVSISTALLNLAALFSLKSPTPHEFDKEAGHCKHCRSRHHSVSSKVNASFPRCQKEAAQSMKCSWSQIRSCLRSQKSPENQTPSKSDSENAPLLTAFASLPTSCPLTILPSLSPNDRLNNPVLNIPNSSQSFARLTRCERFSNCSDTDEGTHNRNPVYEKQKESSFAFKVPNSSHSSFWSCSNLVSSSHLRPPGVTNLIIHSC